MEWIVDWDVRLFVLLNQTWVSPAMDWAMPILTDFDHWRIPVIVLILLFMARGNTATRIGLLFAVLAVVAADQISSSGIKPLFERDRPFKVMEDVRKLVGAHGYSFPSSHAANTFAAGDFLALRFRRWWPILLLPVLVGYSRVYVGVHYPLDVAGGALLGGAIAALFVLIDRASRIRLERFRMRRRGEEADADEPEDSPPRPPG